MAACCVAAATAMPGEWSGYAAAEMRAFASKGAFSGQQRHYPALSLQPEYYLDFAGGDQRLTFTGFLRLDLYDGDRTHADLRELYWEKSADSWEARVGVRKLFWGVTESQHLVDILNQTDLAERPDGEEKLGQPMVELCLIRAWGIVDLYLMPYFRERTFPGPAGRLRPPLEVDSDGATYASEAEQFHLDLAARWSHTVGPFDIGLAHFRGTNRRPVLVWGQKDGGPAALTPHYEIVDQTSLDMQATTATTLWKLETIAHLGPTDDYLALAGGFEYTLWNLLTTGIDLGLLVECHYDQRGHTGPNPFQNDLFFGTRLALNDMPSSELVAGLAVDLGSAARLYSVEASRRLYASWRAALEIRAFTALEEEDPLHALRKDDYVQFRLARYF